MSARSIFVVAGIGNGSGTGAAAARLFAKNGYRVALIARTAAALNALADEINKNGGEAAGFPIAEYSYPAIESAFQSIKSHQWPSAGPSAIRVALFNAGASVWKGFLDITPEDLALTVNTNITGGFAFARQAILAFKENEVDERGKRGTLIITGATASLRGNVTTSAFAAGKFALRALSQSLAKEFGKQNIHVSHAIIDGGILTDRSAARHPDEAAFKAYKENANIRLDPESIAKSYLYLANQDNSAWTWELDLRPAHEKW